MTSPHPLPPAARTAGRIAAWTLGVVLVLAALAAVWIGVRAALAYGHLRAAEQTARTAAEALRDPARAPDLVAALSADTRAARDLTSDPVWRGAEILPWAGPQLHAVSTVAAALDDVASDSLAPLAQVASSFSLDSLRPTGGRIDVAPFLAAQDAATTGAAGLSTAAASVDDLDRAALVSPLRSAVDDVSTLLDESARGADALSRALTLLPPMLGADGPRNYLIVFQNNAEARSLGGIVGAMTMVHTDGGTMSLAAQGSSSDFTRYPEPVLDLGPEVTGIFGTQPARWIQNVTQVPDFSLSGALAREMWQRRTGTAVDGVLAVDPVALSYLLRATGPVELPTGEQLTADDAIGLLLNGVYLRYPVPADQDAFFAATAAAVFAKITSDSVDPTRLVTALVRAGDERRLLMWSAIPDDQAVLAGTSLAGPLPPDGEDARSFGVYLNQGIPSKMDFYTDTRTSLAWENCSGSQDQVTGDLTLRVDMTNTLATETAAGLPEYVTGRESDAGPRGTAKTVGYLYLPEGAQLLAAEMSDGTGFGGGFDADRQVMSFSAVLPPGQTVTATLTVRLATPGAGQALAWTTPTVHPDTPTSVTAACATP